MGGPTIWICLLVSSGNGNLVNVSPALLLCWKLGFKIDMDSG